jgi:hypothetical protein
MLDMSLRKRPQQFDEEKTPTTNNMAFDKRNKSKPTSSMAKRILLLMKRSEVIAWTIVCFQFLIITFNRKAWPSTSTAVPAGIRGGNIDSNSNSNGNIARITTTTDPKSLLLNDHHFEYYQGKKKDATFSNKSSYDIATIHSEKAGLVNRVWHSNGSPSINPNLQTGSCWCGADEWYVT